MTTCYHPKILSILLPLICQTTHILGAVYSYNASNAGSDMNCTNAGSDDICHLYCDESNQSIQIHKRFECGNSGQCVFHCIKNNCLQNGTLNSMFSNDLLVDSMTTDCMLGSTINVPNYGNATFTTSIDGGLREMTVNSGSNTQNMKINCSVPFANEQCRDITVNAETAQYLEISVGSNGFLRGTLYGAPSIIKCPKNSNYIPSPNTLYTAPCIIDMSNGFGTLRKVNIYADYGIPHDVQIVSGADSVITDNVQIICLDGVSTARNNNFWPSDVCWTTHNPTIAPTVSTTSLISTITASTISPTKLPTNNPITIKPTTNPTSSPTILPSNNPTNQPTENTLNPNYSTNIPSNNPTTNKPTAIPSKLPSYIPTSFLSLKPTKPNQPTLSIVYVSDGGGDTNKVQNIETATMSTTESNDNESVPQKNENTVSFAMITDIALIGLSVFVVILCGYIILLLRKKYKLNRKNKVKNIIDSQHNHKMSTEMRNNTDTTSLDTMEMNKYHQNAMTKPNLKDCIQVNSNSAFMPSMEPQIGMVTLNGIGKSEINENGTGSQILIDIHHEHSSEISITGIKQSDLSRKISDAEWGINDENDDKEPEVTNINPLSMPRSLENKLGVIPMTIKEQIFAEISKNEALNVNPLAIDRLVLPELNNNNNNKEILHLHDNAASCSEFKYKLEGAVDLKMDDDAASGQDDDTKDDEYGVGKYTSEGHVQQKEDVILNDDAHSVSLYALPTNGQNEKQYDEKQHVQTKKDELISENNDKNNVDSDDDDAMLRINFAIQAMNDDSYINDS